MEHPITKKPSSRELGTPTRTMDRRKSYIIDHKDKDDIHRKSYQWCFGFRPEVELYDLKKDPGQLVNVADDPSYASQLADLQKQLQADLVTTRDPRATGDAPFDEFEYGGGAPKYPGLPKPAKKKPVKR